MEGVKDEKKARRSTVTMRPHEVRLEHQRVFKKPSGAPYLRRKGFNGGIKLWVLMWEMTVARDGGSIQASVSWP